MHVTSVSREEVNTLRRAFDFYDHDRDGRISVFQFSIILKAMFAEEPMFHSLLQDVVRETSKYHWVYFPDLLGTLVRNRHDLFYEELWDRFVSETDFLQNQNRPRGPLPPISGPSGEDSSTSAV